MQHRARKRFGQHFLTDVSIIQRIVAAIRPQATQHVVEIGPGLGAMTWPLLKSGALLDVIEIDRDLVAHWQNHPERPEQLRINEADVLQFDFATLTPTPLRIVGNLPYNISTPLCFHLLRYASAIQDMTFMLQYEVVERMCAAPNTAAYGRLSVMIQYYCATQHLFNVPPTAFEPRPRVDSAVIQLLPYTVKPYAAHDETRFSHLVKTAFAHPRKTLRNNLKEWLSAEQLAKVTIDLSLRPGALSVADYVTICNGV